jgi:signal transduction histidine kinase
MERNTDRLLELTQQLLDFRKVEAAEFRINPVPVVLQEMLKDRYQRFRSLAVQRKVKFTLELPDMPVEVMADWDAVQKIADNLLSNALSYCHRQVKVTLESSEPVGLVRILMFNDGPGIPENMKEQVFKPFFRLAGPRNKTGAGIGLALARSLAQLHGGDIKVLEPGPGGTLLEWTIRSLPPTQT